MKTFALTIATIALLSGNAFAAKEHCVTRVVTSNDNSLQGLSTVCSGIRGQTDGFFGNDCGRKK